MTRAQAASMLEMVRKDWGTQDKVSGRNQISGCTLMEDIA